MKNFLIPTTLKQDTLLAVKTAINQANESECEIILMIVSEIPDAYSSPSYFLREMKTGITTQQETILDVCRQIVDKSKNCTLKIHNQYGISSPIFKRIIDHFSLKLIIITHSYKQEQKRINQHLVQLLDNQRCPILHLSATEHPNDFNKALYIENTSSSIHMEDIQLFINENFSFQIVTQTPNLEDKNFEEFAPYLTDIIHKNGINLLVKTRKPQKLKFRRSKKEDINDLLGLPILSLCEEMV
ncbi:hypothetical protein [Flavobacterium sp. LB2R40]|uniref:hypothetical protein n=1 Tax=unclassified Flavobacterium TaxID=196869 RepID=UPI003AB0A19F